jgi:hypothetical protein
VLVGQLSCGRGVMDHELVARIRATLEAKSTDELRQVYASGDRAVWSPEALEAMRQILIDRGETGLAPPPALSSPVALISEPPRPYQFFRVVAGLVMVVAAIVLLINVGIVVVGEARGVFGGSSLLMIWYVVLPPLVMFCVGAIVYLLTEIATRMNATGTPR